MLKINVPAGIGDISWSYSKLVDLKEPIDFQISDDGIKRGLEFVKLLPYVNSVKYFHSNFHCICDHTVPSSLSRTSFLEDARKSYVNFSPNRHLEKGNRLENWIPDLSTNFHYRFLAPNFGTEVAERINALSDIKIGIYTSKYENISTWKAWHLIEWVEFITQFKKHMPNATFIFLGAPYDKPFVDDLCNLLQGFKFINICGQTSLPAVIDVLRTLDYFISYPSGLPVISNVLRKPCLMFYPPFLDKLMYAWADQSSILDSTYKGLAFDHPKIAIDFIFNQFKFKDYLKGVKK